MRPRAEMTMAKVIAMGWVDCFSQSSLSSNIKPYPTASSNQ